MNESSTRHMVKAYLVADMDFTGPLPVVRQFCIFSSNPYHEPGLGPNRAWAVLMIREAGSFAKAKEEVLHDLEASAQHFPERAQVYNQMLRLMDEAPDAASHALKYLLPETLDGYVKLLPAPDHPFFTKPAASHVAPATR